jgi:ubiquinone/menaquinone biosynthesis C-methylase UbiE
MGIRDGALRAYWYFERRIVPDLDYAQHHYEAVLDGLVDRESLWLDVGCGHQLLPPWRAKQERLLAGRVGRLVGVEVDLQSLGRNETVSLRVGGDAAHLPFADGQFHLVTANMVLEHLPKPVVQFQEIARVLRPGGRFLFHTPNARGHATQLARLSPEWLKTVGVRLLENRREEDRFPTHYRANTVDRIAELASQSGLAVADLQLVSTSAMFSVMLPLAIIELFWIRRLQRASLAGRRSNLIGVLMKPREEAG